MLMNSPAIKYYLLSTVVSALCEILHKDVGERQIYSIR